MKFFWGAGVGEGRALASFGAYWRGALRRESKVGYERLHWQDVVWKDFGMPWTLHAANLGALAAQVHSLARAIPTSCRRGPRKVGVRDLNSMAVEPGMWGRRRIQIAPRRPSSLSQGK